MLHENNLMVVVPVVQNGVEGGGIRILTHEKEFPLSDGACLAVIRQFESVAEILEGFWFVAKDQQEIGAVFNVVANLVEPTFDVRIYNP